jgi:TetR/AcrR family tetracycline transcriptional repressor
MSIDKDIVVEAALALLDEVGLDGLTMRKLAERLGVQNPALYWHFKNKQELLDRMAERMIVDDFGFGPESAPAGAWDAELREFAALFRSTLLSRKDGARLVASADLSGSSLQSMIEMAVLRLEKSGCGPEVARTGIITLLNYTLGSGFEEQQDPLEDHATRRIGFERSLDLIIAGIAASGFEHVS